MATNESLLELAHEHIEQAYALLGQVQAEPDSNQHLDVTTGMSRLTSAGRYVTAARSGADRGGQR